MQRLTRRVFLLGHALLGGAALLVAVSGRALAGAPAPDLRIGALVPMTGVAASVGPEITAGIEYVLEQAGYKTAGRRIVLIKEDESDNPAIAVAKARKLVEGDHVDVVIGPLLAHNSAAVAPYLARAGVANLNFATADGPVSRDAIYALGPGAANATVAGRFAAQNLKARRAAVLVMDYAFGHQMQQGFTAGFTAGGGKVVSAQALPMGTADLSSYLEGLGSADLLAVLLTNPTDLAFVRQYREYGLKVPVIFISAQPQEEPILQQMADDVLGMYGVAVYGPEVDTPENRAFVARFVARFKRRPGIATMHGGLWTTTLVLQAATAAATADRAGLLAAVLKARAIDSPVGRTPITANRMGVPDNFVFRAARVNGRYVWSVVARYPGATPR